MCRGERGGGWRVWLLASVERELVTGARLLIAHSVPASHVGASQVVASSVDRILSAFRLRRAPMCGCEHPTQEPLQMKKQTDAQVAMGQHVRFIVDREEYASKGNLHEPATDL